MSDIYANKLLEMHEVIMGTANTIKELHEQGRIEEKDGMKLAVDIVIAEMALLQLEQTKRIADSLEKMNTLTEGL